LGKEFELDEALVSFYGPVDNPDLNIRTLYEPPEAAGITIFYMIEGSLMDPEFRFESEPDMELQDIIGYTLFGKPFYELESWEQVIAGSGSSPSASDYALDILLDRVELLASEKLGIDVVQIDNTRSGSSNSTAIKTGWYLNQRTLFAILNEVGGARPKTLFILEYMLRENLELIVTQGDDSREGIDLKWQLDY
jgi:autotransporter translocation and assembly factor TamB